VCRSVIKLLCLRVGESLLRSSTTWSKCSFYYDITAFSVTIHRKFTCIHTNKHIILKICQPTQFIERNGCFTFKFYFPFLLLLSRRFWCNHIKPDSIRIVSNVIASDFIFMGLFYRFSAIYFAHKLRHALHSPPPSPTPKVFILARSRVQNALLFYLMLVKRKHEFPAGSFLHPFV
jgi:hypothetical protein